MVHLKKVTRTNLLIFCLSCILWSMMMNGDKIRLHKDFRPSNHSWQNAFEHTCVKQSIEPFTSTLVCGCLLAETTVFCSVDVRNQNLWTFWQWHNWSQHWPKQTHTKSRSNFFGVTRAVPHATRTAISHASVTTFNDWSQRICQNVHDRTCVWLLGAAPVQKDQGRANCVH